MRQRVAGLLPVARRGRDPDPETAAEGPVGSRTGEDAAAGRLRPHHRLRRQHAAAGLHERDPDQPDLEQGLCADAGQPGLATRSRALILRSGRWARLEGWGPASWFETRAKSALLTMRHAHTSSAAKSFKSLKIYSLKPRLS